MLVETCVLTGEAAALKTIIDLFLLAAYTYIAGFKQLALLLSAPLASCYGQMIQNSLKSGYFAKTGSSSKSTKRCAYTSKLPSAL